MSAHAREAGRRIRPPVAAANPLQWSSYLEGQCRGELHFRGGPLLAFDRPAAGLRGTADYASSLLKVHSTIGARKIAAGFAKLV